MFTRLTQIPGPELIAEFERDMVDTLAFDGGEVTEPKLESFLAKYFGFERAQEVRRTISSDLQFFRANDPASTTYNEAQILSVRRGMAAIAAHRIFGEALSLFPELLYYMEVIAKYVQKDTNVEIHPTARIDAPFGIDHGHSTVIGATAVIGKETFIYHGVTLGATGRRSKSARRHPIVGSRVFFGNGSQVLGPAILEDDIQLSSGVIIKECRVHCGVRFSVNVHISNVIVPEGAHVFSPNPENPRVYWAKLAGAEKPAWVTFERFDVTQCEE